MSFLHEMGGLADLVLKARVKTSVGAKTYAPGEIVLLLKDVTINFSYDRTTTDASSTKTLLEHQDARPSQIMVADVSLTNSLMELLFTPMDGNSVSRTRQVQVKSEDGETLLLPTYINDKAPVFIYEYGIERTPVSYVAAQDNEIIGQFDKTKFYIVQYSEKVVSKTYSLEVPSYPWMSMELYFKGNSDKRPMDYMMNFDAVYLAAVPTINILREDIQKVSLAFTIIYKTGKEPQFVLFGK